MNFKELKHLYPLNDKLLISATLGSIIRNITEWNCYENLRYSIKKKTHLENFRVDTARNY